MGQFDFESFKKAFPPSKPKYEIVTKLSNAHFKVTLVADCNDGDYLTTIETYSEKVFESKIIDELMLLQTFFLGHDNLIDAYDKIEDVRLPFEGQSGQECHTLETMKVEYIDSHGTIYDVNIFEIEYEEEV